MTVNRRSSAAANVVKSDRHRRRTVSVISSTCASRGLDGLPNKPRDQDRSGEGSRPLSDHNLKRTPRPTIAANHRGTGALLDRVTPDEMSCRAEQLTRHRDPPASHLPPRPNARAPRAIPDRASQVVVIRQQPQQRPTDECLRRRETEPPDPPPSRRDAAIQRPDDRARLRGAISTRQRPRARITRARDRRSPSSRPSTVSHNAKADPPSPTATCCSMRSPLLRPGL